MLLALSLRMDAIEVRATFDGSKNEQKPAQVNWIKPAGEDHVFAVDIGAKVWEKPFLEGDLEAGIVTEWHRHTSERKPLNSLMIGTNVEWIPLEVATYQHDGTLVPTSRGRIIAPLFTALAGYEENREDDKRGLKAQAFVMPYSTRPGLPGARSRVGGGTLRYYPYLGAEVLDHETPEGESRYEFGVLRVRAEWQQQRLLLATDYAYRQSLNNSADTSFFEASATFHLDQDQHFGIGVVYKSGEDPSASYEEREQTALAFTIKF
jgi:hypothetical protein